MENKEKVVMMKVLNSENFPEKDPRYIPYIDGMTWFYCRGCNTTRAIHHTECLSTKKELRMVEAGEKPCKRCNKLKPAKEIK